MTHERFEQLFRVSHDGTSYTWSNHDMREVTDRAKALEAELNRYRQFRMPFESDVRPCVERYYELESHLAFLRSKGITVGMMKVAGKEAHLAIDVAHDSPYSQTREINRIVELEGIVKRLRASLGHDRYDLWFGKTRFTLAGDVLVVEAAHSFAVKWIDNKFRDDLTAAASAVVGRPVTVEVRINDLPSTRDAALASRKPEGGGK